MHSDKKVLTQIFFIATIIPIKRRCNRTEMNQLLDEYGRYTFNDETMKERIPKSTYKAFHEALDKGEPLSKEVATVIANAMKTLIAYYAIRYLLIRR